MTANNNHQSEVDVLSWVCGELSAEQIREAEALAAINPAIRQEAAQLRTAISAISATEDSPTQSRFRASLREQWASVLSDADANVASAVQPQPSRLGTWYGDARKVGLFAATAAAFVIAVLFIRPGMFSPSSGGVAWGDVIKAMRQVQHFHVTAFADQPRQDKELKMSRLDMFYQHPGRFRAHGLGHITIVSEGKTTLYNFAERKFEDADDPAAVQLVPSTFVERLRTGDVLSAVIATMFQGDLPDAGPVKSVDESSDIHIFDYALDAKNQWARVWVLKESRLPIRIKVFNPGSDSFLLAEFDYSDPRPASFFDAAAFARQLQQDRPTNIQRVYAIGTATVNGKLPLSSDQLHQVQGKARVPAIKKVFAATSGDIVVVTDSPAYDTAHGRETSFDAKASDSWGNEYVAASSRQEVYRGDQTVTTWYFAPVAKFKSESSARTITIDFLARTAEQEAMGTARATVPTADDSSLPKESPECLSADKKGLALWAYLVANKRDRAEQFAAVDRWLADQPDSLNARLWKFDLLLQIDQRDEAVAFFEKEARDRLLGGKELLGPISRYSEAMGQFIHCLFAAGQEEQALKLIEQLNVIRQAGVNSKRPEEALRSFDAPNSLLHRALQIPRRLSHFYACPKPTAGKVVAGKDGFVVVELKVSPLAEWPGGHPDHPEKQGLEARWVGNPHVDGVAVERRAYDLVEHRVWIAFKTTKPEITISDTISLTSDSRFSGFGPSNENGLKRSWALEISVPKPSVDSIDDDWWNQNVLKGP